MYSNILDSNDLKDTKFPSYFTVPLGGPLDQWYPMDLCVAVEMFCNLRSPLWQPVVTCGFLKCDSATEELNFKFYFVK